MLDARTLIFAVSLTLVATLITVFISSLINRNIPGVRQWISGYALLAAGLLLQGSQGLLHPMLSIFTANILIPSGFAMICVGILKYKGRSAPPDLLVLGVIMLAMLVMHLVIGLNEQGFAIRTILMSSLCGGINLFAAMALLKTDSTSTTAERFTGMTLLAMAVALFIRAATTYDLPDQLILTTGNAHNYFTYALAMVFNILLSFGLVIMPSERLHKRLNQLANTDFLTGVLSRRAFANYCTRLMSRSKDKERALSLLLFDIDDFKKINDAYGHAAGDMLLQRLCEKITHIIRPTDVFGRLGGEEFAILLTDTTPETAGSIAERIRQLVAATCVSYEGNDIRATISLGMTGVPADAGSFENIYRQADKYLYQAKHNGKNCVATAVA